MNVPGDRRPVAVAALAVLLVAGVAGVHLLGNSRERPLDAVPADVDYVGHLDAEAMHEDPAIAKATRAGFRFQERVAVYEGPAFRRSFAVGPSSLDRSAASSITYFGRANGSAYRARIVRADWATTDLVTAVERANDVTLTRRDGEPPMYVDSTGSVAVTVLGEDRYAVGNATAVRDAVAVSEGEAPAVDGPLRRTMEHQRPAHARFAFRFDPTAVPALPFVGPTVRRVTLVSAGYYVNETGAVDHIGVRVNVTTESESTARSLEGMLTLGERYYDRSIDDPERAAIYDREMAKVEFDSRGRTTLIRYETTPRGMQELLAVLRRV